MKELTLQLERYFFTDQHVVANPDYIPDAENNNIPLDFIVEAGATRLDDHDHKYGISIQVKIDQEKSENPPYFFSISAFGVISVNDDKIEQTVVENIIETSGAEHLLGAIRERLADITARGPWNMILLDFTPVIIKLDT